MDFPSSLYIPLLFTFLLLFLARKKTKQAATQNPSPKLAPGPPQLPLIGNIHNFLMGQPHEILRNLATKYGPLMYLKLGEVSTLVVSSPAAAEQVMKTHDLSFASRPFLLALKNITYHYTDVVFAPYGHYWRQLRKICVVELLNSKRVESLRPIREEEAANLMQAIRGSSHSPVNLREKIAGFNNNVVTRSMVGRGIRDREVFLSFVSNASKLSSGFFLAEFFPSWKFLPVVTGLNFQLEISQRKLDSVLDRVIEDRRTERDATVDGDGSCGSHGEDLLDVLLVLQQDPTLELPITTDNIKAILMDMFGAGTETSTTLLVWAMSELMKNPRVMRKAQEEARQTLKEEAKMTEADINKLHYLKLVIKETLRMHPPVPLLVPRECREDAVQIDGYDIPISTRVMINVWAIGRDPQYWEDPEMFWPERFEGCPIDYKGNDFELIPFGSGRRMCPGMALGIANVILPLAQLLYYFDWELPGGLDGEHLDMSEDFGIVLGRKHDLCLIPVPRLPLPSL